MRNGSYIPPVHPNAASAGPDGTIFLVAHVLETKAEGRKIAGIPADLVLEQEPEHKKGYHEGKSFTLRLLIYRPHQDKGGTSQ